MDDFEKLFEEGRISYIFHKPKTETYFTLEIDSKKKEIFINSEFEEIFDEENSSEEVFSFHGILKTFELKDSEYKSTAFGKETLTTFFKKEEKEETKEDVTYEFIISKDLNSIKLIAHHSMKKKNSNHEIVLKKIKK